MLLYLKSKQEKSAVRATGAVGRAGMGKVFPDFHHVNASSS